jgi:hypothetical protein
VTSLVSELQAKALSADLSVTELLRMAKVVAVKLDLPEFQKWVNSELEGYHGDEVPQYRVVRGQLKAFNPFRGLIPVTFPTDELAETTTTRKLQQKIAEVEKLANHSDGNLTIPFPDELQLLLQNFFKQNMEFRLIFQPVTLIGVVEAVRNIVLDWSLTLEKNGIVGDGMSFSGEEKSRAHSPAVTYRIDRIDHFTGNMGPISGGIVNVSTVHNAAQWLPPLLKQVEENIGSFGFNKKEEKEVLDLTGRLRTRAAADTFDGESISLLQRFKVVFENAGGALLAQGVLHELGKHFK